MKNKFKTAVDIAGEIIENGGEISRAEETIERICKHCGAEKVHTFIIPSLISATVFYEGKEETTTRRIYINDLNLGKIEELNNTARRLCNEKTIDKIDYNYNIFVTIFSVLIATGAFCIYFGGTLADAVISGISGIIITYFPYLKRFNNFSKTLVESTVAGILSYLPNLAGLSTHPDKIMIGTIMLLIPGMSVGLSIKDLMSGNQISGIIGLTNTVITATAIAMGFIIATIIFGSDYIA